MSTRGPLYTKTVLVRGQPTDISCFDFDGSTLQVGGFPLRTASIEDEWFDELARPDELIRTLASSPTLHVDLLRFWNPIPETRPRHAMPYKQVDIAVLPVSTYSDWWLTQIKPRIRNLIRKSQKEGLEVREARFDDAFVEGMSRIFNETPVRQGRPFWHYGKDPDAVRKCFSRFVHRETMIGAYLRAELVGFIMLGAAGQSAYPGQILSRVDARHLNPNNALIAKAVEICAIRGTKHLVYGFWGDTSLAEFKRRCGFEPVAVPHYRVPLTAKGRIAVRLGLDAGISEAIPPGLKRRLRHIRSMLYGMRDNS